MAIYETDRVLSPNTVRMHCLASITWSVVIKTHLVLGRWYRYGLPRLAACN